jgi:hypothetical protein
MPKYFCVGRKAIARFNKDKQELVPLFQLFSEAIGTTITTDNIILLTQVEG